MSPKLSNIVITGFTHRLGGGGGNMHFNNLVFFWESLGTKVTIFDSVKVIKFTFNSVLTSTLHSIFLKIDGLNEMNNCDIIVSESPYPPDIILALRLSSKYMKPVAVYFHHITPAISIFLFRRGILRVFLNVTYTSCILYFVKKFRIPIFLDNPNTLKQSEISVFPNLIALSKKELNYEPIATRLDMDYDVCYIGRIENHKGVEDIIRVVGILKNKYSMNPRVILAGKGKSKYVARVKKMIDRFGLSENIVMSGYVSEDQKFELLKRSHIFLFLSYEEGWAISVMEAASVGTPIVAYSLPAYYYLKGNYFPVEVGNIQLCAETVKRVIDDNASAIEKVKKAKECVDKFSYGFIAKQQLIFFRKIVKDYGDRFHE
jgi:glycosyltransferase involved in cell wall biosynthesis